MEIKTPISPPSAVEIIRQLDAKSISDRIDEMDRERDALLVLLRAARRAEKPKAVQHAN